MIDVTITGADEAVDPSALAKLSAAYPFVEWGILFSATREGTSRYPSLAWRRTFQNGGESLIRRSAHLCGRIARGQIDLDALEINSAYGRLQINGYEAGCFYEVFSRGWVILPELILQARSEETLQEVAERAGSAGHILFDPSGGRGAEPFRWPPSPAGVRIGYAGGIGPSNVEDVVNAILEANGFRLSNFWIDMESGVRDAEDRFDLARVVEVLEKIARINAKLIGAR